MKNMTPQQRANDRFRQRQTVREIDPRVRVWGLLRFPFSTAVREHTIQCLLADPATREITIEQLGRNSAIRNPRSALR